LFTPFRIYLITAILAVGFAAVTQTALWKTGRMPAEPLALVKGGTEVLPFDRIWIDTDAACGAGPRTDPDDCFAVHWLLERKLNIVGISTSFGNASGQTVIQTMSALSALLKEDGLPTPPVFTGHPEPVTASAPDAPGVVALRSALAVGPVTILALGPLTNIAEALNGRKDLQANVRRIVAVMGHQKGHLFHPSEGGNGALFGHGPIFRDLNVSVDPKAAEAVLAMNLPMTLIPYDAGRATMITAADLDRLASQGKTAAWLSASARGWLDFWQRDVGVAGFSPFDWVAAAYLADQRLFDCAPTSVRMDRLWAFWLLPRQSMLVSPPAADETGNSTAVLYCPATSPDLHDFLVP